MNIAINAFSAYSYGGLQYLKNLLSGLLEKKSKNIYFVFVTKKNKHEFDYTHQNLKIIVSNFAGYNIICRVIWEQFVLPFVLKKLRIDTIYIPNGMDIFFSPTRTVVCVQNMEVFTYHNYPNAFTLNMRSFILNIITRISLRTADHIIAVSNRVKKFLEIQFDVPDEKISCIYHGRDTDFAKKKETECCKDVLDKFEINKEYIFTASKMVAYSNMYNLLKAFERYSKTSKSDIMLVIAGGLWDNKYAKLLRDFVKEKKISEKVKFLEYVGHSEMPALFWGAKIFAFPSTVEACPITLIEALTAGAGIITSNIEPMPEICKDAAVYFDPNNVDNMTGAIKTLVDNQELIIMLREKALKRAEFFSWKKSVKKTQRVLEGVKKMSKVWNKAQELESEWWKLKKEEIISQSYRNQIKERSVRIEKWIDKKVSITEKSNILEIGGGATQLIDFFDKGNKYAVDPLADMYQREFSQVLDPKTKWHKAKVEEMPFEDSFFDVIIIRNVLDHVDSASKALKEINRVLKDSGVLYLGMNTFSGPYYVYKLIVKDPEHPYTFTPKSIRSHIVKSKFKIVDLIDDAPENMKHFSDQLASVSKLKAFLRDIVFSLNCFHFSEFLLKRG
ncbi:MAG: glycosyltransferase [Candidatus Omnitrophota bacterium]